MANLLSKYVVPGCRVDLQEIEHTELDDEMDEGYTLRTAGRGYQSKVLDILSEDKIEVLMPMEKSRVVTLPVDGGCTSVMQGSRTVIRTATYSFW